MSTYYKYGIKEGLDGYWYLEELHVPIDCPSFWKFETIYDEPFLSKEDAKNEADRRNSCLENGGLMTVPDSDSD